MKYIKLTPQNIGTEDMKCYLVAKFEKLQYYKKFFNQTYEQFLQILENSVNLNKTDIKVSYQKDNYIFYEILKNETLLFFKNTNNPNLEGKIYKNEIGVNILVVEDKISQQEIEKYIDKLYEPYLNIYYTELKKI